MWWPRKQKDQATLLNYNIFQENKSLTLTFKPFPQWSYVSHKLSLCTYMMLFKMFNLCAKLPILFKHNKFLSSFCYQNLHIFYLSSGFSSSILCCLNAAILFCLLMMCWLASSRLRCKSFTEDGKLSVLRNNQQWACYYKMWRGSTEYWWCVDWPRPDYYFSKKSHQNVLVTSIFHCLFWC